MMLRFYDLSINYRIKKNKNHLETHKYLKKKIYHHKLSSKSLNLENWLFLNFNKNFYLCLKFQIYLKRLICDRNNLNFIQRILEFIFGKVKFFGEYVNCRLFLIKVRQEKPKKFFYLIQTQLLKSKENWVGELIPFNSLGVVLFCKVNFYDLSLISKNDCLTKNFYQNKIRKWCLTVNNRHIFFYSLIVVDQKKQKVLKKKTTLFYTKSFFLEKTNIFFENFFLVKGISTLISFNRKSWNLKTVLRYFKAAFLRLNNYQHLLSNKKTFGRKNFKTNQRPIKEKFLNFVPLLSTILRFQAAYPIIFSKLISNSFEILPSKSNLPLKFSLRLSIVSEIFNNQLIHKRFLLSTKKKKSQEILYHENEKIRKIFQDTNQSEEEKTESFVHYMIFKKAEDFLNEEFGIIILSQFDKIFREERLNIWLNPLTVHSLDLKSGFMEVIPNSISLHCLHKILIKKIKKRIQMRIRRRGTRIKFYKKANQNFVESLTGASLLCFFLQIKDRHDNNILINSENRIIHIDFGFILGDRPGWFFSFEASFFKLSQEFLLKIGGKKTEEYEKFKEIFIRGFFSIKKSRNKILTIFNLLYEECKANDKKKWKKQKKRVHQFKKRFKVSFKDKKLIKLVLMIIRISAGHWKTQCYDRYQLCSNRIN